MAGGDELGAHKGENGGRKWWMREIEKYRQEGEKRGKKERGRERMSD